VLKPNLVAQTPARVRVFQNAGARRITFTTMIANLGQGPLTLEGRTVQTSSGPVTEATQVLQRSDGTTCTHVAGYFVFHPSHHHWHINDMSSYELRKDDPYTGQTVARSTKVSFCLADIHIARGYHNPPRQVFPNCGQQEGTQGISVGWEDVYESYLPDQWIDLDLDPANPVPAGQYYLVNVPDPDQLLLESDYNQMDKTGVISVGVPGPAGKKTAPHPRPARGPTHDKNLPGLPGKPRPVS
jgi:hypothetical protein